MRLRELAASPAILIKLFVVLQGVFAGLYVARSTTAAPAVQPLNYVLLLTAVGYWFELDTHQTKIMRVWDARGFWFVAWYLIIPYYVIRTRGLKRTLLTTLKYIGLYFGLSLTSRLLGWFFC